MGKPALCCWPMSQSANTISGNLISGNPGGVEIFFGSGNKIQSKPHWYGYNRPQNPWGDGLRMHIVKTDNNLIGRGPLGFRQLRLPSTALEY